MNTYIPRRLEGEVISALKRSFAVAIVGARQIGKTTLADKIAGYFDAFRFDLSLARDRATIRNSTDAILQHADKLVIFDEVQFMPELFQELRSIIDARKKGQHGSGRFLFLGSAEGRNLGQRYETLAGRLETKYMHGLDCSEVPGKQTHLLWERGGFPESFTASDQDDSMVWREQFLSKCFSHQTVEIQDRMYRLFDSIAGSQGSTANFQRWGRETGTDNKTLKSDLFRLENAFLIRRLLPYYKQFGQRLVKAPKYYIRDSGLFHSLWNVSIAEQIQKSDGNLSTTRSLAPANLIGNSWEGFAIENLCSVLNARSIPFFYRSYKGMELDLIINIYPDEVWAIEAKHNSNSQLNEGNFKALEKLQPSRVFIAHAGDEEVVHPQGVLSLPLRSLMQKLREKVQGTAHERKPPPLFSN